MAMLTFLLEAKDIDIQRYFTFFTFILIESKMYVVQVP